MSRSIRFDTTCSWNLATSGSLDRLTPGKVIGASVTVSADARDSTGYAVNGGNRGGVNFTSAYSNQGFARMVVVDAL